MSERIVLHRVGSPEGILITLLHLQNHAVVRLQGGRRVVHCLLVVMLTLLYVVSDLGWQLLWIRFGEKATMAYSLHSFKI